MARLNPSNKPRTDVSHQSKRVRRASVRCAVCLTLLMGKVKGMVVPVGTSPN